MANKNSMRRNLLLRKELKQIGKPVDSRFGAAGNLNKSRKDYARVGKQRND